MPSYSRLFFALWPDFEILPQLARIRRSIKSKGVTPIPPHNLHVTLVFIGNVDDATASILKQRAADISAEPFALIFDHLSYWLKPRVACLTSRLPAPEIFALRQALNAAVIACGIPTDSRPYNPHITLAKRAARVAERDCDPIIWRAQTFCLAESCSTPAGVVYKVKERWPLSKITPAGSNVLLN